MTGAVAKPDFNNSKGDSSARCTKSANDGSCNTTTKNATGIMMAKPTENKFICGLTLANMACVMLNKK